MRPSPQPGRVIVYDHGAFAARVAPTILQKTLGDTQPELWLALLTRAPNADGGEYEELVADGYVRQRVTIASFNGDFDANVAAAEFNLTSCVVAGVGLLDAEDRLRFYGFCSGHRRLPDPPKVFMFPAFEVKIRKLKIPEANRSRPQS